MPSFALAGRELLVERRAHDRMDERQASGAREDVGADEVIGGRACFVLAETCHMRRELRLAPVAEHGD